MEVVIALPDRRDGGGRDLVPGPAGSPTGSDTISRVSSESVHHALSPSFPFVRRRPKRAGASRKQG